MPGGSTAENLAWILDIEEWEQESGWAEVKQASRDCR